MVNWLVAFCIVKIQQMCFRRIVDIDKVYPFKGSEEEKQQDKNAEESRKSSSTSETALTAEKLWEK